MVIPASILRMIGGTPSSPHLPHLHRRVVLESGTHALSGENGVLNDGTGTTGLMTPDGTIPETVIGVGETPTTDPSHVVSL